MAVKKILVVDDSPTEREALDTFLSSQGFDVITAKSGDEAIALANAQDPDLILMDVVMPGLNGFQATRSLTRSDQTRHIPVIICSGKAQDTDRIWGLRQGAADYLVKPIDRRELLDRIAAVG